MLCATRNLALPPTLLRSAPATAIANPTTTSMAPNAIACKGGARWIAVCVVAPTNVPGTAPAARTTAFAVATKNILGSIAPVKFAPNDVPATAHVRPTTTENPKDHSLPDPPTLLPPLPAVPTSAATITRQTSPLPCPLPRPRATAKRPFLAKRATNWPAPRTATTTVRDICLCYTCWWYSLCNFQYRQH